MIGPIDDTDTFHLIDFGLSKKYLDSNGNHVKLKFGKDITGTLRYCSRRTHLGQEQSRRDDLESLGYTLIYLAKGVLPW